MNEQVLAYLPVLSPIATLIVVMLGVFAQNRHVDNRISDLHKLIQSEAARLEAVIKAEIATVRLDIQRLENRVKTLEERAGVIVPPSSTKSPEVSASGHSVINRYESLVIRGVMSERLSSAVAQKSRRSLAHEPAE